MAADFSREKQHDVTPTSGQHCRIICSSPKQWRYDAVIDFLAACNTQQ